MEWTAEIEGEAMAIYRAAKLDPDRPAVVGRLVHELLGTRIERATLVSTRESDICMHGDRWVIGVHRRVGPARARWLACHELAHWWFDRLGYRGEDIEARCDALGAALIAPRPAWLAARKRLGSNVRELALALVTTQSLVLLRHGECEGTPAALVQPRRVLVRGCEFAWPDPDTVRKVAKCGHPALRKVRITDEPQRVGLLGDVAMAA